MRAASPTCHAPVRSSCRLVDASALPAGGRRGSRIADGQRRRRQRPGRWLAQWWRSRSGRPRTAGNACRGGAAPAQFRAGVLVVQTGTRRWTFPTRTRCATMSLLLAGQTFEIKLYAGRPAAPVLFDRAGVITLGCNIHDQMIAHVVVVDTFVRPHRCGQPAGAGEVPAGEHRLRPWHPDMRGARLQAQPAARRPCSAAAGPAPEAHPFQGARQEPVSWGMKKPQENEIWEAVIERFEQQTPASVMARMVLEEALPAKWMNEVFGHIGAAVRAQADVVDGGGADDAGDTGAGPSLHAAARQTSLPVSVAALYEKGQGTQPGCSERGAEQREQGLGPVMDSLDRPKQSGGVEAEGGGRQPPGAQRRRGWGCSGGKRAALPGHSLVVYDPDGRWCAIWWRCEDSTSASGWGDAALAAGELWVADSHFCTRGCCRVGRTRGRLHRARAWTPERSQPVECGAGQ